MPPFLWVTAQPSFQFVDEVHQTVGNTFLDRILKIAAQCLGQHIFVERFCRRRSTANGGGHGMLFSVCFMISSIMCHLCQAISL